MPTKDEDLDDPLDDEEEEDEGSIFDALDDDEEEAGEGRRQRLERILPQIFKRAIEKGLEAGIGTISNTNSAIRGVARDVVGDNVKLPKEIAAYVFSQIDDTKRATVRVVAREVREFLHETDLAHELQRALTSLSFEIRTEIRFKPNPEGGVTPEVTAKLDSKDEDGPEEGEEERPRRRASARRRRPKRTEDDDS